MTSLSSLTKAAADLFEEGYLGGQSLRVKTVNDVGLEVLVEGELTPRGAQGSISASTKTPRALFNLDKLRLKTDGRLAGDASYILSNDPEVDSRLYVAFEDGRQEPGKPLKSFGKAGSKLKSRSFDLDASIDVVNGPTLRAAALYQNAKSNLSFGVEAQVNTHWEEKQSMSVGSELEDLNMAVAYTTPQWSLSGRTTERARSITLAYLHHIAPNFLVGSQLHYGLDSPVQTLKLGVNWDVDNLTTVKGKVDSAAIVSASFKRQLADYAKLTICATVDAQNLSADSHKFGIGLAFE